MKKHLKLFTLLLFCSFLGNQLHAQTKCPTSCPPCSIQNPITCECTENLTINECIPISCDDGNPCTVGDVEERNCDGTICVPCAGITTEIESIVVVNMRDCDDQGNTNPNDDTFVGDIVVTFNYSPVIEDFIITGDTYFSYREAYCVVNDNTITIEARTFSADGGPITLHGILNDRVSCSFTKNGLAGVALEPCNEVLCVEPGYVNTAVNGDEVVVTWGTQPSDVGYEYRYKARVGGSWRGNTTTAPMAYICELGMNKAFDVQVRSLCCEAEWSVYSSAYFETGDFMKSCDPATMPDLGCIYGITIDYIWDCYDNGSVHKTSDDYLEAKVTVHFGEELPARGVLELSGMVAAHVDLAAVGGSSYTFPGRLRLRYNTVNYLTAVVADYHSSHARICPINVYCSYTDNQVFVCDPCTPNSLDIYEEIFGTEGSRARVYTDLNNFDQNSEYTIEKSIDGVNFDLLSNVENTDFTMSDNYLKNLDETPELGDNYYRLTQVFEDGSISYSPTTTVNVGVDLDAISFFPNPVENELYIDLDAYQGQEGHMIITNQLGQIIEERSYDEIPSDLIRLDFSRYTNGLYFVRTKVDRSKYVAKKVLVSKYN